MSNSAELDLVRKALTDGLGGCVERDVRVIDRVGAELARHGLTLADVQKAVIQHVRNGGSVFQVQEDREDDDEDDEENRPRKKRRLAERDDDRLRTPGRLPADPNVDSTSPNASIGMGILMMVGALVWFVGGLFADIIFFYPPILFILGIVAVVHGAMKRE